jgi:hypothetical protein
MPARVYRNLLRDRDRRVRIQPVPERGGVH